MKKTLIQIIIIALNLITYRLDALLNNLVDGIFLINFKIIFDFIIRRRYYNITAAPLSSLILHMLYMVVYIVNDLIDYSNRRGHKPGLDITFYNFRPIYFFHRSNFIIAYAIFIYLIYLFLAYVSLPKIGYLIFYFIFFILVISIIHSACSGIKRIITFYLLRFIKYIFTLVIFNILTLGQPFDFETKLIILTLVIPYLIYTTLNYGRRTVSMSKMIGYITITSIFLSVLLLVSGEVILILITPIDFLRALLISYLTIVIPAFGVRQLLRRILGADNPTYYQHIIRLALGACFVFILAILAFYILTLIY